MGLLYNPVTFNPLFSYADDVSAGRTPMARRERKRFLALAPLTGKALSRLKPGRNAGIGTGGRAGHLYIACGNQRTGRQGLQGFAAIFRKALVFVLLCCLSLTASSRGSAEIDPLSAVIYDILTYTQDAEKGTVNGLKFNLGASGGVGPYGYSIALYQNGVEVFRTSYTSGGEKLLPFQYLGSGTYRLDLTVKDVSGFQAFASRTVNIHNAGGRVTIFDVTPATPSPAPTATAAPDPAASPTMFSPAPPGVTPVVTPNEASDVPFMVTPSPAPTPTRGRSYFYQDNTACSEGFSFRDLKPGLTNKWYTFTPLDLSVDAEMAISLIASNLYRIGTVNAVISNGSVTVTYQVAEGILVKSEFMTLLPSLDDVREVEPSLLSSSALPFGRPASIIQDLSGDTKVLLLYVNLVVDYNGNEKGIERFSARSPAHIAFLRTLKPLLD